MMRCLFLPIAGLCFLLLPEPRTLARLGDTEAQAKASYGEPVTHLSSPKDEVLLAGAVERTFHHEGWRIRAAFLNDRTARIEYVRLAEGGGPKAMSEAELAAILEAEKGVYRWREEKPRTGYEGLNQLKTAFEGRLWERSDHAAGRLKWGLVLTLETREVAAHEKKQAREAGKTAPAKKPNF